ncbi:hypothetical protein U1Q18_020846, partial [Sarracenia purpurea var. burkii]
MSHSSSNVHKVTTSSSLVSRNEPSSALPNDHNSHDTDASVHETSPIIPANTNMSIHEDSPIIPAHTIAFAHTAHEDTSPHTTATVHVPTTEPGTLVPLP